MRFLILALIIGVAFGQSTVPAGACPPANRDDLKQCLEALVDKNIDAQISSSELTRFLDGVGATCLPNTSVQFRELATAANIITMCDTNADGVLSQADWVAPNACVNNPNAINWLCRVCYACGWQGPQEKRK